MDQRSPVGLVQITLGVLLVAGLAGVVVPARAQDADGLSAGRSWNQDFARLGAVGVTDVTDSGPLVAALREAADSAAPLTKVVLLYDAYGDLRKVQTGGTRSPAADSGLERAVRSMTKPVTGMPNDFMATIVRLNRRDIIDISPFPLTCPPGVSWTPQAMRIAREGRRFPSPAPRVGMVQPRVRSSGAVADPTSVLRTARP